MASYTTPVLHVACLGVFYIENMCITHVLAIHVLYLYFYICNTCVRYTPLIYVYDMHLYYMCETCVLQVWYLPVTTYVEPLATWVAVWTFIQVVSMSALQAQDHGFDPHCG